MEAIAPELSLHTYEYELPAELIAQSPAERRDAARLLVLPAGGGVSDRRITELPDLLRPGDLLVANDTRVLPARFFVKRRKGGAAQVLLLHPTDDRDVWLAMARPGKRIRPGDRLALSAEDGIEIVDWAPGGNRLIRFYGADADAAMRRYGQVPLPPYIRKPPADAALRYQTVYADKPGSVAAPTAGLHFTTELIGRIEQRGVRWSTLTLDVGAGTFRPVKAEKISDHHMHAERYEISAALAAEIARAKAAGSRVIAVGTTSLRALEDAARRSSDGSVAPGIAWTDIFIYPPFEFRVVAGLLTNFHLPRSTLLMLVCAFGGTRRVLTAYEHAVRSGYRFYSFGDAMFIEAR